MNHLDVSVKGFIPLSMLDWPGKMCSVIFLGGCNFRCPACHNHELVMRPDSLPDHSMEEIIVYLSSRSGWIDGVTITGGEPTVNPCLETLLSMIAQSGVLVKLDTNGSNPMLLEKLISNNLISSVSMDVKTSLEKECYSKVAGVRIDLERIKTSINMIRNSGIQYCFRTTVIPGLVGERELTDIKRAIGDDSPFIVQAFKNLETLDPQFRDLPQYDLARFEAMRDAFEIRTFH